MSYFIRQSSLGSTQSRPMSRMRVAMGSTQSRPASRMRVLGTLGDDTPSIDPAQSQWQQELLATAKDSRDWQARWVKKDETQRWIQIGATISIPLFAAIWRAVLGRRRSDVE